MKLTQFKTPWRAFVLLAMMFMVLAADRSDKLDSQIPDISQRINTFTMELLKQHSGAKNIPANTILSPQSIFHGLAMSYIASAGETREELAKVVHFPKENGVLLKDLERLRKQFHKTGKHKRTDMTLANSAWLDQNHADFQKAYVEDIQNVFEASLHRVEFKQKERVSADINNWISEKTHGKIQKSVAPGDFMPRSAPGIIDEPALVTVNAVYFKADWGSRFDKASTRNRTFHTDEATTLETPMMHQRSLLPYSESAALKFLEIPYIDDLYSMYVILPMNLIGIRQLIQDVTMEQIIKMKQRSNICEVDVIFPKFEMESHLGVKETLAEMGVKSAFSNKEADFEKMIIKKFEAFRIYISEIYHDAWIDIHEEGTKAAAATSTIHISFGCSGAPGPMPVQFHADHPFLFMIVHNESRSILFAGWISNPRDITHRNWD